MTNSEKLELFEKFDECTELTDGVHSLLAAASVLGGIGCDHEVNIILILIEKLIKEYCEMARDREFGWKKYVEIDDSLYSYILGGSRKLTKEEYES